MKVLVTADLAPGDLETARRLAELIVPPRGEAMFPADELERQLLTHRPEVLVVDATEVSAALLARASSLRLVICTRGNPVNVDVVACRRAGIALCNTPGRNANAVAEFTIAMIVNLLRRIPQAYCQLRSGEFTVAGSWSDRLAASRGEDDVVWLDERLSRTPYFEFQGREIAGKTLGLIGLGQVGRQVARKAKALDMEVIAFDPYAEPASQAARLVSLEELARAADVVSLHAKQSPETRGMIDARFLALLRRGAYLINGARGSLIDRDALLGALQDGQLAGAALDVFDYEPLCPDDPLLRHPAIICTPHLAGASSDVVLRHSTMVLASLQAFARGEPIPNRIA